MPDSPLAADAGHPPSELPSFGTGVAAVRLAGVADAGALHEVAAATFALACPPGTTQLAVDDFIAKHLTEEHFAGYLADPQRRLLLAELDGIAVGYTMLVVAEPTDVDVAESITLRPTVELSKCYVVAGLHGAGVGAMLIEESVVLARAEGAAGMWLGVNEHNPRANRFYDKSGFRVVGRKKFLVGGKWEDDFVRERAL